MTTLIVGATGATGRLLVEQLLNRGMNVKVIVRSPHKLADEVRNHSNLSIVEASVLELTDNEMADHVRGCTAVASCLGHTMDFKGMYGQPRMLVTDAVRRLCNAIKANTPSQPVKFVLMNTAGNSNRDIPEKISFAQQIVMGLLRLLVPPVVDNEKAAEYLRVEIGQDDPVIEWAAVRPSNLTDESEVTEYETHRSPTLSAIFEHGETSRINVGHFMADLIADDAVWDKWKGQMPVIYNKQTE